MTPFWIDSELHWHTGDVLRKVMIATDLSAKTVAERSGVDPRTVRAILKTGNYERNALQRELASVQACICDACKRAAQDDARENCWREDT